MARSIATDTLTLRQLNRATLARQSLLAREPVTPLRTVERLLAMQAQWPKPPFLGLFCRVEGFERSQIGELLGRKKVVRATFARATLHLVGAKDYLALRPTIQPVLERAMASILKSRGATLDAKRLSAQAREFLAGGPRTFEEIRDHLLKAHPKQDARAMGYAVRMMLPLVMVPEAGAAWAFPADARFALADLWLGKAIPMEASPPDPLVLRYLAAYGPATVADIQAWSGLPKLRETIEALRPKLRVFRDDKKRELFDLPDAPRPDPEVPAPVRFVPEYDNVIVTRADERFVARVHRSKVFLPALRIAATVLVDGFVAATWKLGVAKGVATVAVEPFAPFSPRTRKEVTAEAEALARFAEPDARAFAVRFEK